MPSTLLPEENIMPTQFADVIFPDTVKPEDYVTKVTPEQAEEKGFVIADHAKKIQAVCNRYNCYVSIRETGKNSLTRLHEGYPAKGHHILDKSLKDKSLTLVRSALEANGTWDLIQEKCLGFVGYWESNVAGVKIPIGVRTVGRWIVSSAGNAWTYVPDQALSYDYYVPFADIARVGSVPPDAYTGDYDMHEILVPSGTGRHMRALSTPAAFKEADALFNFTKDETWLRTNLVHIGASIGIAGVINRKINRKRKNPTNPSELIADSFAQVIQHGPQHGFPAFTLTQETTDAAWVHSLINFDPPVLAFSPVKDEDGEKPEGQSMRILWSVEAIIKHLYTAAGCTPSPWWMQSQQLANALTEYKGDKKVGLYPRLESLRNGDGLARRPSQLFEKLLEEYRKLEAKIKPGVPYTTALSTQDQIDMKLLMTLLKA
jgi:hypothetical protein